MRGPPGRDFLAGFWFALARIAAIYIAGMFCILFVALTLGVSAILAAIIASSLAYFFLADFLYIGRLAAYLSLADWPLEALVLQASMPLDSGPFGSDRWSLGTRMPAAVDRDELILSDVSVGDTPQPS